MVQSTCSHVVVLCALLTGVPWALLWGVLTVVLDDIAPMINWFVMMKLEWVVLYDVFAILRAVHVVFLSTSLIAAFLLLLWKQCQSYNIAVFTKVFLCTVVLYNAAMGVVIVRHGGKIITLFLLVYPHIITLLFYYTTIPLLILLSALLLLLIVVKSSSWSSLSVSFTQMMSVLLVHSVAAFLLLYSTSMACDSCSRPLPPRPSLTAHRGCSMDLPENSIMAFKASSTMSSVVILESDVQITLDGYLFLQHDHHLARTTNIAAVCPSIDPLHTAAYLSFHEGVCPLSKLSLASDMKQPLALFSDYLQVAADNNLKVMFDVYTIPDPHQYPSLHPKPHPQHHPHLAEYVPFVFDSIHQSSLSPANVLMLTRPCPGDQLCVLIKGGKEDYPASLEQLKEFTKVGRSDQTSINQFKQYNMTVANEEWSTPLYVLRELQHNNITVNMYTINSILLYEYAWCVGVVSVTTDKCHLMSEHNNNYLHEACHSAVLNYWSILLFLLSASCAMLALLRKPTPTFKQD